jgi:thiol-disulfide isomerase/thioredoxin
MGKKPYGNLFTVFLDSLEVKYTCKFAKKIYAEHPHKYNMYGLSKMLSDYRIPNQGMMLDDPADVATIEPPFIAQFGGDLYVVEKITDREVLLFKSESDVKVPIDKFKEGCTGVVLVAEPDENSIEPGLKENRRKEIFGAIMKYGLYVMVCIAVIYACVVSKTYTQYGLLSALVINLAGVYISYLLVLKQVHFHSQSVDKICSMFNKKSDCNSLLDSKAAKFLDFIGWSELGLGYFISNTIIVLFAPAIMPYLALLSAGALCYTVWSVWYQWRKAKQWCLLCLIVQVLFVLMFVSNLAFGFIEWPTFTLSELITAALVYAIPFLCVSLLLPIVAESMKVENITYVLNHFKMNEEVFKALLVKQPEYEADRSASRITFGNPEAEMFVTIVSNPHCNPCSKMHPKINKLIEEAGDGIFVQLFFLNFDSDTTRDSGKFLISAYLDRGREEAGKMFTRWFDGERNSVTETFAKYSFDTASDEVIAEQERHNAWCEANKISSTPTVLVNGYRLPENYEVDELTFL